MRGKTQARKTIAKQQADGLALLTSLGMSQADLSRLFEVDRATVSQWYRLRRIGTHSVGRAARIPLLRKKGITVEKLRPDLSATRLAAAVKRASKGKVSVSVEK